MYEAILGRIDAVMDYLGLAWEDRRLRPGVNPWGYSGGSTINMAKSKEEIGTKEKETHSVRSSITVVAMEEVTRT
jgi:hypothetical protein